MNVNQIDFCSSNNVLKTIFVQVTMYWKRLLFK